jgi:hypothetical protein
MNLASALTAGLKADIKITQADVNLGNQMMFLGIVVLEIPSNMLLQRVSYAPVLSRREQKENNVLTSSRLGPEYISVSKLLFLV